MKKIDGHIHFAEDLGVERLNAVIEELQLEGVALQCIPKGGRRATEEDAFAFQKQAKVPVWIFGGINRRIYERENGLEEALANEIERILKMGCVGIKMLEGKPDVRKNVPVPDFHLPVWEKYWSIAEKKQIPIVMHVNDPEEFWDPEKVSEYAKKVGWFYDETYINNEAQYAQMEEVLLRHPGLRILFPHFFFLSKQIPRLSRWMERFPNLRIDVTPGIELYYNLSERSDEAKAFFEKYQDRICYGTDIGARSVILQKNAPLSYEESRARNALITQFLENENDYIQEVDGYYVREGEPRLMHGLGLPEQVLEKIYRRNFLEFICTVTRS